MASAFRITRSSASDRKSTRLNSSHMSISYAVFCLKKKKNFVGTGRMVNQRMRGAGDCIRHAVARQLPVEGLQDPSHLVFFFFNDTATTEISTLSLHDALPI